MHDITLQEHCHRHGIARRFYEDLVAGFIAGQVREEQLEHWRDEAAVLLDRVVAHFAATAEEMCGQIQHILTSLEDPDDRIDAIWMLLSYRSRPLH